MQLYQHQIDAVKKMHNGCILCGGVGSGKSRTALTYYFYSCGGKLKIGDRGSYKPMDKPRKLYIITTAKKRDNAEWLKECMPFYITPNVIVDSWNNIKKYSNVYGAFFIFDEQRLVGSGAWVKAFYKIAKKNKWILLSATPGDTWSDYIPVFVANGFYKNKTEFCSMHCVYNRFSKYPKIERYMDIDILEDLRSKILVEMPFERHTIHNDIDILCQYDKQLYKAVWRDRWNPYTNKPIAETGELFYTLRKVVNNDISRLNSLDRILKRHRRAIVFYNFNYEVDALKEFCERRNISYGEWNGHRHTDVPVGDRWLYLVQYTAGSEGWNCITCDTIVFFSQNYSYKVMTQAAGRIDRLNTPYSDLYFYYLKSRAPIDLAINKALKNKKKFNERMFLERRSSS